MSKILTVCNLRKLFHFPPPINLLAYPAHKLLLTTCLNLYNLQLLVYNCVLGQEMCCTGVLPLSRANNTNYAMA